MKILVIFTGGTIGSTIRSGYIGPDSNTNYSLLQKFADKNVDFFTLSPYTVLSENLSAKELNALQKEIASSLSTDYDGIIVTHGTDTLQYSACAIENAFCDINIPIIFVSSDYPLEDTRTNGFCNFDCAVKFIENKVARGVFVSYKNENENFVSIHIPSRLLSHTEGCADLLSIDGKPFAAFDGKAFEISDIPKKEAFSSGIVEYVDYPEILVIDSHPADSFSYPLENVKAVIIKPYHSATLDTANKKLADFCKSASEKSIPVYVCGMKNGENYESTKLYNSFNITPLPYGTFISAYMELWAKISSEKNI